jgi:hypothetical protein
MSEWYRTKFSFVLALVFCVVGTVVEVLEGKAKRDRDRAKGKGKDKGKAKDKVKDTKCAKGNMVEGGEEVDKGAVLEEFPRFGQDEALFYFSQMVNAVQYLHSLNLVHRDLVGVGVGAVINFIVL